MAIATVNDIDIHYRWDGDETAAQTILLSNSLASNLSMWDPQIDALTGAGFRVLRYDSRGHGQSGAPDMPYTIELLSNDALGLIDHLELAEVHFCGLSMGGMVGQYLATHHSDRLRSVVLCATAAHLSAAGVWDERRETVLNNGMAAVVDGTIERWFTADAENHIAAEIDRVREGILTTPAVGYANCCLAIRDMDQRESIRGIMTPTLVVAGSDDPSTPVAAAEEIQAAIAGAELSVINKAQHLLNIEQAEAFNTVLIEFLNRHR